MEVITLTEEERKQALQEIQNLKNKNQHVYLTRDEEESIKADLLSFIHSVSIGEFQSTEHILTLCPVVELVAKYFRSIAFID